MTRKSPEGMTRNHSIDETKSPVWMNDTKSLDRWHGNHRGINQMTQNHLRLFIFDFVVENLTMSKNRSKQRKKCYYCKEKKANHKSADCPKRTSDEKRKEDAATIKVTNNKKQDVKEKEDETLSWAINTFRINCGSWIPTLLIVVNSNPPRGTNVIAQ